MNDDLSYKDYVNNQKHMDQYSEYQKKYATKIRESDKVIIELINQIINKDENKGKKFKLLDVGCSTGNLLFHLKNNLNLELYGCDLSHEIIDQCRKNPALSEINFEHKDLLDLGYENKFDIITANVILFVLNDQEFNRAILNVSKALKDNGWFVIFDLFHQFEQEISIIEKSKFHQDGLPLHFRSYKRTKEILQKSKFSDPVFKPFNIPLDLEKSQDPADINSYTIKTVDGDRMCFRGTLFQPWCHVIAPKKK